MRLCTLAVVFVSAMWIALTQSSCGGDGGSAGVTPPFAGGDDEDAQPASFVTFQAADTVIGQADSAGNAQDQGGAADANTLDLPNGRIAPARLFIADTNNHRILVYSGVPTTNNAVAAFVLGQSDFATTKQDTSLTGLRFPADVWINGDRLFVADSLNHRVLIWNTLPTANTPADIVVGQPDFNTSTSDTTQSTLSNPTSVAAADNRVFVAERGNHRVLIWNSIPTSNGQAADVVVGQLDFVSNAPTLSESGLDTPASVWSDGTRLVVSDGRNNRVLIWNSIPTTNGQPADTVLGQPDFASKAPGLSATRLSNPRGVYSDGVRLFIADRDNNRVLIFDTFPATNNAAADVVIGQGAFDRGTANDDNQDGVVDDAPSARTLNGVTGVIATTRQLFVTDRNNNRVLIFNGQ